MAKRIFISLAAGLLAAVLAGFGWNLAQVNQQRQQLQDSVLRLHILAQSDSQVDQAVGLGLFNGRGSEFDPSENITRGEFAAALANLAGVDTTSYAGESVFSDVNGQWYTGAVNWAYENGYMNGMGDGTFGAANQITREQICVTLANYAGLTYNGSSEAFADDSSIASWAKNAVYACRERGIISGMGGNTFAPKNNATRVQACVVILNAYNQGL